MEISRQQFASKLPTIKKAIQECDFLSIDTELSGLHRPIQAIRLYNMKDRYEEYREATEKFIIIQFGLCTFHWEEKSCRYIAKPFNFYIFPTSITGHIQTNRLFMTQAQAFDFLTKQSFDFNKWVYQGIPYLTKEEEVQLVEQASKKLNDEIPDIPIDGKEKDWMNQQRVLIEKFVEKTKNNTKDASIADGLHITTRNAYQRRLLYQEVRKFEGFTAIGVNGAIKVVKLSKKQLTERNKEKFEKFEKDCIAAIGFRKVIDMISESKKPIVGHNMLLDICHVIHQFVEPLPKSLQEFKKLAHNVFPVMIDTKYICSSQPELMSIFNTATALENLKSETDKDPFTNPYIEMHPEFPRYLTEMAHEAGYDAYMTGHVFLRLTAYLDKARNPEKYKFIEQQRLAEAEEKEREREKKKQPRVDADGWEITDDEDDGNSGWNDEEEEVYNYGSIRVDLVNKNGRMDNVLANITNKTALVRTAYSCFDFIHTPSISNQFDGLHVAYQPGTVFDKQVSQVLFSKYGKHIIEPIDEQSSFVMFEDVIGQIDPHEIDKFTVTPISKYLEK